MCPILSNFSVASVPAASIRGSAPPGCYINQTAILYMNMLKWSECSTHCILPLCDVIYFAMNDDPAVVARVVFSNFFLRKNLGRHLNQFRNTL